MHDRKIHPAMEQRAVGRCCVRGQYLKGEAGISLRQTADHAGDKSLGDGDRGPDCQIASRWVSKEPNILDTLLELVEHDGSAPQKRTAKRCWLDTLGTAIEKPNAERVLEVGNRPRNGRLGSRKKLRSLAHAASFNDGHQNTEIVQTDPAFDTPAFVHDASARISQSI